MNGEIMKFYINKIIPAITRRSNKFLGRTDDGNYGSSACRDVDALEAISRRIHYGESGCFTLGEGPSGVAAASLYARV